MFLINLINLKFLCLFIIFTYLINLFFLTSYIRYKYFLCLILLICFSSICLYYNLDGIVLLFLVSELSVFLIFIFFFSYLYNYIKIKNNVMNNYLYFILFLNYQNYNVKLISYYQFYSYSNITLNDFYFIYNFFFEKQILFVLFIIFFLTFFSFFFIIFYFNLKQYHQKFLLLKKNIINLRKQNIVHQCNYKTTIRAFQQKR